MSTFFGIFNIKRTLNSNQKYTLKQHYLIYGCSKGRDEKCPCGYIREAELIDQLTKLMDQIDLDEIGIKEKIKVEIERFKKFQRSILGISTKIVGIDIDIRNYAKYVLREAPNLEKRELLECLRSQVVLKEKEIFLSSHPSS